jgi:hypothetical protein
MSAPPNEPKTRRKREILCAGGDFVAISAPMPGNDNEGWPDMGAHVRDRPNAAMYWLLLVLKAIRRLR